MPNSKNNTSDPKNNADSKNNIPTPKNNNNNNMPDPKNNNPVAKNKPDLSKSNSALRKDQTDLKNNNATAVMKNNPDLTKTNSALRKDQTDVKNSFKVDAHPPPPSQGDGGGGNAVIPSSATQSPEKQSPHHGSKNASSERGGEANLTLGGIDINSSGSVAVKIDKKLLTVLFPDGREGRSFTLKAETLEDLLEWKAALVEALENAPAVGTGTGQTGISTNEKGENDDGFHEQSKDHSPPKSLVLGRPVLLALEDVDGTPSFLEKALRYVEEHGIKVEGILRQAADVELVERRIQEYEQGKTEFTADEDGHVIGDCIKYVLRELPSSPVPASCCKALLQAYRTDRGSRVNCMHAAICDTFPEPNRRLLQRILMTMEAVAENKDVNRMSVSAVAACMSPLLLRPLLAGEVELENEFNMGGDGSAQLMQAAAAANHAQAIIIALLEEYDNIFGEGDMLSDLYSDSYESGSESEELSGDDAYEDGDYSSDGSHDSDHASNISDDDIENYQHERKAQKKTSVDNIDVINDERQVMIRITDVISRLETLRTDLMKKVEAEVATLKEQLQRERELRKLLEGGLLMSKKVLPLRGSIDEKTKADLADIAQTEAEVISLQQKLDDLELQLTEGKVKDKEKGHEALNTLKSKQSDSARKGKLHMNKSSSTAVKGSNSRDEAANANSTLSKITNTLSFFKEKPNKMTNESETVDNRDRLSPNNDRGSQKESKSPEGSSVDTSSHLKSFNKPNN
ncbi:hypothetical protein M8C21_028895 [Ambrosia artemisiifolia]|uniref:Rho-GAP domain-containing protein n=1 Tax=Ambrosia artemisiifolia TaxID=4212 RepID=A0AAD5GTF4_AMBAR|nr:hypothetical protein M8C21_028895 [Ambrosia artemisiifolia]